MVLACFILSLTAVSLLAQPQIRVQPEEIDDLLLIDQEREYELSIANVGDEVLHFEIELEYIDHEGDWLQFDPDDSELEPDDEAIITVAIDAHDLDGEYEAQLTILSNDPENDEVVFPVFIVVTDTLDWWPGDLEIVAIITQTVVDTIILENPFDEDLIIDEIVLDVDENFFILNEFDDEIVIEPGEELEIEIAFHPMEEGLFEATLTIIIENNVNRPEIVCNLTGRGILPPEPEWELMVECDCCHAIIVDNATFEDEDIDAWYVGLFYSIDPDVHICCGFDLWRGDRIGLAARVDHPDDNVNEGFQPGQELMFRLWDPFAEVEYRNVEVDVIRGPRGYVRDALTILTLDGSDDPLPPNLIFDHAELDFPDTYITQQSVQTVIADNWGEETVVISEFEVDNDANFSILLQDSVEIVIDPNEELEFEIAFHPQAVDDYEGIVTFETNVENEDDGVFQLLLSGRGVDSLSSVHSDRPRYPDTPTLHSPAPNPFNSQTRISYHIPVETHLDLALYDISGREVMTLFSGVHQAGVWSAAVDGSDLASGLYVVRMNANGQQFTKKMICIK